MDRAVESEEVTMSMIADRHQVPADGAVPVDDVEFQESEIRVVGPVMWHGVDFPVVADSLPIVLQVAKEDTREARRLLAGCEAVVLNTCRMSSRRR